jgi:regulator of protease activity HflC (stomatin/prohibitin superfamily)
MNMMNMMNIKKHIPKHIPKRAFITVVNQAEIAYREFLGKDRIKLNPGLHVNIPIFHKITRISLKENCVNLDEQHAYTKDNVHIRVSGALFYKVIDPEKACFTIDNPLMFVKNVGESSFCPIIGQFDYDEIISNRSNINKEMLEVLDKTTVNWGLNTTRLEIKNVRPYNFKSLNLGKQNKVETNQYNDEHTLTLENFATILVCTYFGLLFCINVQTGGH